MTMRFLTLVLLPGMLSLGCGSNPAPTVRFVQITGKVTLPDGNMLPNGHLSFLPLGSNPTDFSADMKTDKPGTYSCLLAPGKYKVVIEANAGAKKGDRMRVPEKYQKAETSDAEIEVKAEGEYNIALR